MRSSKSPTHKYIFWNDGRLHFTNPNWKTPQEEPLKFPTLGDDGNREKSIVQHVFDKGDHKQFISDEHNHTILGHNQRSDTKIDQELASCNTPNTTGGHIGKMSESDWDKLQRPNSRARPKEESNSSFPTSLLHRQIFWIKHILNGNIPHSIELWKSKNWQDAILQCSSKLASCNQYSWRSASKYAQR